MPYSSAMISLAPHPLGVRVGVLAVGGDDVVVGLQRRDRADRHRLLADIKVQEAADLAQRVGLGQRLLHAADRQHLVVVAGELGLVRGARGLVRLGSLTLDCAHCQGFSGPLRVLRVFEGVERLKSAKIYQEAPRPGNFNVGVSPQLCSKPADVRAAMEASSSARPARGPDRGRARPRPGRDRRTEPRSDPAGRRRAGDRARLRADAGRRPGSRW